ncbi:MAG: ATPase P [Anaerolineae bacterium]|jgi:P-type E1-E2 ATPase
MKLSIAGRGVFQLDHLVLDVNGTVASGGMLIAGVRERLVALRQSGWQIHWITADTRGRQAVLDQELGWPAVRISPDDPRGEAEQKAAFVRDLGAGHVVAVGNGSNDALMLREAAVGIAVLGPEGLALDALEASDLVAPGIHAALDLLLDPERLVASWRR